MGNGGRVAVATVCGKCGTSLTFTGGDPICPHCGAVVEQLATSIDAFNEIINNPEKFLKSPKQVEGKAVCGLMLAALSALAMAATALAGGI